MLDIWSINMNKFVLIVVVLVLSISLDAFENLKSLSQLKEHRFVFLVFEKNGCPWCIRYKNVLESGIIDKYGKEIKFFRAKKGTKISSQFRKKLGYKIIIYPMTYIFKSNKDKELELVDDIYGYQTEEYLEELFQKQLLIK